MWVKLISNKFESQTSERRSSSEKKKTNKQAKAIPKKKVRYSGILNGLIVFIYQEKGK